MLFIIRISVLKGWFLHNWSFQILGQLGAGGGVILYNGNVHVFLLFLFYRRCFSFLLSFYLTKKEAGVNDSCIRCSSYFISCHSLAGRLGSSM